MIGHELPAEMAVVDLGWSFLTARDRLSAVCLPAPRGLGSAPRDRLRNRHPRDYTLLREDRALENRDGESLTLFEALPFHRAR